MIGLARSWLIVLLSFAGSALDSLPQLRCSTLALCENSRGGARSVVLGNVCTTQWRDAVA